jgi:hypothetical protein
MAPPGGPGITRRIGCLAGQSTAWAKAPWDVNRAIPANAARRFSKLLFIGASPFVIVKVFKILLAGRKVSNNKPSISYTKCKLNIDQALFVRSQA